MSIPDGRFNLAWYNTELERLEADNARLRAENESLRSAKEALENDVINANGNLAHAEAELAALRADIEAGRMVRVPCKKGDTVWAVRSYRGLKHPQQGVVSEMYFNPDMKLHVIVKHVARGELGKTIFLTREEAEKAARNAADKNSLTVGKGEREDG